MGLCQMLNAACAPPFTNKIQNLKFLSVGPSVDFFINTISWYYRHVLIIPCWNFDW